VIEIRQCLDERDEEESLALYNAVWPTYAFGVDEVRSWRTQMLDWVEFLAPGAGSAAVSITPWRPELGDLHLAVLPDERRRGVGSALYRGVSAWLGQRDIEEISAAVPEDDPESLGFAERRGFVEHARSERLVLELADREPPPVEPPEGIEIVTWAERPDVILGVYEVACEALPDIPGEEDALVEPFEDWLAHDMQGAGDRPEATFVAVAGGEVVAYAKFSLNSAQPTTAYHDLTGVKRAWRGRGIAGALKRAQVQWAKEHGYEQLVTTPDLRNEPSRRMNERLGYRPAPGKVIMRGPLAR
jgi:GNAT superfamily N-acetyltransferase